MKSEIVLRRNVGAIHANLLKKLNLNSVTK